ncbi:uncharacterized protein SPSK_10431 [Sporothrix schenckii 1099-18]|uniref:Secreted protein n=1 Tax=Sporothrix schenckii 1099-18 TaxID=1397361 RepID=A0A0F2MDR7_SPOSC|nr:uncharacterized protein SPSK_10431 [Sporothrix schenckii 1099-18]KJR86975.1 hypothetical protein SPSK_10431 [Sporothrix schenckii 1099-18]
MRFRLFLLLPTNPLGVAENVAILDVTAFGFMCARWTWKHKETLQTKDVAADKRPKPRITRVSMPNSWRMQKRLALPVYTNASNEAAEDGRAT